MNHENILKVADAIEEDITKFDMQYPFSCVAGYAAKLFGHVGVSGELASGSIHLGLRSQQAYEMFYCRSMDSANKSGIEAVTEARELVPDALRYMVEEEDINWRRAFTAVMMNRAKKGKT